MIFRKQNILHNEYATFRKDVVEFFLNYFSLKGVKLLDPMSGTIPLLPYAERCKIKADFFDILPVHTYINNAKRAIVYRDLQKTFDLNIDAIVKELESCIGKLDKKKLLISDDWLHEDILNELRKGWNKVEGYGDNIRSFFKAIIILCTRHYGSFYKSPKNTTWHKPGGLSTDRNLRDILVGGITKYFNYYKYYYADIKNISESVHIETVDIYTKEIRKKYDIIFTSPAFPNRYDYVRMYAPELYFLSVVENFPSLKFLNTKVLGTNTVTGYRNQEEDYKLISKMSPRTASFLNQVRKKQKPKEYDYYFRYFTQYYIQLFRLIDKLSNCLSKNGGLYLVVQNNVHKGELNEVDQFISDYCKIKGFLVKEAFSEYRSHQGRRNISAEHPIVLKKQKETILEIRS